MFTVIRLFIFRSASVSAYSIQSSIAWQKANFDRKPAIDRSLLVFTKTEERIRTRTERIGKNESLLFRFFTRFGIRIKTSVAVYFSSPRISTYYHY